MPFRPENGCSSKKRKSRNDQCQAHYHQTKFFKKWPVPLTSRWILSSRQLPLTLFILRQPTGRARASSILSSDWSDRNCVCWARKRTQTQTHTHTRVYHICARDECVYKLDVFMYVCMYVYEHIMRVLGLFATGVLVTHRQLGKIIYELYSCELTKWKRETGEWEDGKLENGTK